jgi:hypothetical protein
MDASCRVTDRRRKYRRGIIVTAFLCDRRMVDARAMLEGGGNSGEGGGKGSRVDHSIESRMTNDF